MQYESFNKEQCENLCKNQNQTPKKTQLSLFSSRVCKNLPFILLFHSSLFIVIQQIVYIYIYKVNPFHSLTLLVIILFCFALFSFGKSESERIGGLRSDSQGHAQNFGPLRFQQAKASSYFILPAVRRTLIYCPQDIASRQLQF